MNLPQWLKSKIKPVTETVGSWFKKKKEIVPEILKQWLGVRERPSALKETITKPRETLESWLKKRPEVKPMVFEVGAGLLPLQKKVAEEKISLMAKEAPPAPTYATAPVGEVLGYRRTEERMRKGQQKIFKKFYPERYKELARYLGMTISPEGKKQLVEKGIMTQEEVEIFSLPEMMIPIGGMQFVGGKPTPDLARQILKVKKGATESAIKDSFNKAVHEPNLRERIIGITKDIPGKPKVATELRLLLDSQKVLIAELKGKVITKVPEVTKLLKGKVAIKKVKPEALKAPAKTMVEMMKPEVKPETGIMKSLTGKPKGVKQMIPVKGIIIEEPGPIPLTPSVIKDPIEVVQNIKTGKYHLYDGQHRLKEAEERGDKLIEALIAKGEPVKGGGFNILEEVKQLEIPGMPEVKVGIPVGKPKEAITPAKMIKLRGGKPATKEQMAEAYIVAKKLKLIITTEAGKISDVRYRRLMKGFSGKSSMKEMTRDEADDFINAIESVVQRQPWEPPVIPLSTKIVPKEFFDITFKEPGLAKVFTPKEYYQRILGTEPLLKPVVDAKKAAYLEQQNINKWIDGVVKRINKQAKVSLKEKAAAKILNKPTEPVAKMRDLLDQYETAPDFLSPEETKLFTEVRDFTKGMLERTNKVREKLGLDPIREVKAYITHYLDELSRQIVQKKYPFPEDVKYWLGRNMPAKIYNPTAMERRVKEDLEKMFSRDLGRLLKAMSKYDLRDIYLSEPYSVLRAELNALGDKIPASTRKELDAFLRHDIFNYPDELDSMLNKTLEKPTQIINWFYKPFNRVITNPVRSMSGTIRRLVMGATIWGRPKLAVRNMLTQKLLTMNLYPVKNYLRAQFWKTPEGVMEKIRNTTFYKLSRRFEDIPEGIRKIEWAGMVPYQKSHAGLNYLSNVDTAMKVGYYAAEDLVKQCKNPASRFYKYLQKRAEKDGVPLEKYLWTEGDILKEAEEAGSLTQWLYFSTDMPWVYRGYTKRALMTLQSWWQNFFFKHQREAISRMVRGKTSWGKPIPPSWRLNWIKGNAIILGITEGIRRATGLDYGKFLFLWGPAPAYLSPPGQILVGLYNYMTADSDWKKKKALNQIKYSYKAFIPGSMAWRDLSRFMRGEITFKEFLFYTEKEKKPGKLPEGLEIELPTLPGLEKEKTMEELFKPELPTLPGL